MEAHIDKVKQQFSKQSQTFDSYQNEDAKNTFTENVVKAMQLRLPIFNDLTMWLNVLRKIPAHSYPVVDTCNIEKNQLITIVFAFPPAGPNPPHPFFWKLLTAQMLAIVP